MLKEIAISPGNKMIKKNGFQTFEEARDNVEKAWRIVEARPLALEQAAALVAKTE